MDMDFMMRYLTALLCLLAPLAFADPVTVSWQLPDQYCGGAPLLVDDLTEMEIYVSTSTIPASDVPCGGTPDVPPTGGTATVVTPSPTDNQVDIDLTPGFTYFIRARVRDVNGVWSNFSNEVSRFVQFPRPDVPTLTIINLG